MGEWEGSTLYVTKNDPDAIRDFCSALIKYEETCREGALAAVESGLELDTELSRYQSEPIS